MRCSMYNSFGSDFMAMRFLLFSYTGCDDISMDVYGMYTMSFDVEDEDFCNILVQFGERYSVNK